jgi:hypothetical protein
MAKLLEQAAITVKRLTLATTELTTPLVLAITEPPEGLPETPQATALDLSMEAQTAPPLTGLTAILALQAAQLHSPDLQEEE